jgi:hypothetical protein
VKERDTERTVRGPASVLALLLPSLGIAALGVYHLCGFDLHALHMRRPHLYDGLTVMGVITALVTAGAALGDLLWWATRDRPGADTGEPCPSQPLRSPRPSQSEWLRTPGRAKK